MIFYYSRTVKNAKGAMSEEDVTVVYLYIQNIKEEPVQPELPFEQEPSIEPVIDEPEPEETDDNIPQPKQQTKPKQNKTMLSPKTGVAFSFLTVAYFSIGLGITILFIIRKKGRFKTLD